jgi:site-specific recombinase XerD
MFQGNNTLTDDELNRFLCHSRAMLESIHTKQIRNGFLAILLANTGLRIREASMLLISDLIIGFTPMTSLRVRPEIAKTKKERLIPLNAQTSFAINAMQYQIWGPAVFGPADFAFRSVTSPNHLTTRQAERVIAQIALESLGHTIYPHMLRHTFASRILKVSNIRIAQELLGHTNIQSTQIYTHPDNEELSKAVNNL